MKKTRDARTPRLYVIKTLCELAPVGQSHIALAQKSIMHTKCCTHIVAGLSLGREMQVIPQELTIVGVSAILNDGLGTLHRTLATKVSNTLLSNHDVHTMLVVVHV